MRDRAHHGSATAPGAAPHAAANVGKRTLTMDLPPAAHAAAAPPSVSSGGQALPAAIRAKMEASFGADFSAVRIHQGGHAASLGALGYTQGNDIHFAPGQYQPDTPRGQELLGHELAHVVQQSQGRVRASGQAKGAPINDDHGLEHEADQAGARAAQGQPAGLGGAGGSVGTSIQMMPGETIKQIAVALGVGLAVAGTLYYALPVGITTALLTGGVLALGEYWQGIVASYVGVGRDDDPGTGGLGLGFGKLHDHEDAFGKQGAIVEGNLDRFRTKLRLTALAPPLTVEQSSASQKLSKFPIGQLKALDNKPEDEIHLYRDDLQNKAFIDALKTLRTEGMTNLQIGEACNCYLRVIDNLLGSDGSTPTKRTLAKGIDGNKPSSLSTAILEAMYREKYIRSNLAGFSSDQIDFARKTSPILGNDEATAAREAVKEDLRNDDCNLWNAMNKTKFGWSTAVVQISVWELATLMHTPELKAKTKFYNYNISDKSPSTQPLNSDWVFTGKGKA